MNMLILMRKFLFIILLGITACVSDAERQEALYRYESLIRNQCSQTLAFPIGTHSFIDCRRFYNDWFASLEIDTHSLSNSKAKYLEDLVVSLNQTCRIYWGGADIVPDELWRCIQDRAKLETSVFRHQKQLDEQEDILLRKIATGKAEANERVLWQERVEAERQKVAREKGKRIDQVKCRTIKKMNGDLKVRCR